MIHTKIVALTSILFTLISTYASDNNCGDKYLKLIYNDLEVTKDIVYGNNITSENKPMDLLLDVYEPKGDTSTLRPLVIYLTGGTFVNGSKEGVEATFICEDFARRGYVSASVIYRQESSLLSLLSQEAMIKAVFRASEDFKASVRYFFKSAKDDGNPFRIDTTKIIVGGASAGSIAVMHAVFLSDIYEIQPRFQKYVRELGGDDDLVGNSGNPEYSFKVLGVINVSGALQNKRYLENDTVPLLNIHNEVDFTIPYVEGYPFFLPILPIVRGSNSLHHYYKGIGQKSTLLTIPGFGHVPYKDGDEKVQPTYDNTIQAMTTFAQSLFKCAGENIDEDTVTNIPQDISLIGSIYPNPTNDFIRIQVNDSKNYFLEIFNVLGQSIYTSRFQYNDIIKVSDLSSKGMHFIKITDEEDIQTSYSGKILIK